MTSNIIQFEAKELSCVLGENGKLGKGSFGTVVLAFHTIHNAVALKCMNMCGGYSKIRKMERNFNRELENLQKCNHENVVRIHGWAQWSDTFALVMEYLPGGNLMDLVIGDYINRSLLLQLRICSDIANGLSFIHNFSKGQQLVHGDIKPENIMLTMDLHCKVSDFGSAKLFSSVGGLSTSDGSFSSELNNEFSEIYACPELLKSPKLKPHPSMDTYSYGMLVYVVLDCEMPVKSESMLALFKQSILEGQRPDLEDILDNKRALDESGEVTLVHVVDTLISAMENCWKQDPSARPSMLNVKKTLHEELVKIPPASILQCVSEIIRDTEASTPSREHDSLLVPANQHRVFS